MIKTAKLIWLGEPVGDDPGPEKKMVMGIPFTRGEEIPVSSERLIEQARLDPSFSVDGKVYVPRGAKPHPNAPGLAKRDKVPVEAMFTHELRAEAARRKIDIEGLDRDEARKKLKR
jgi:hypothetical protein